MGREGTEGLHGMDGLPGNHGGKGVKVWTLWCTFQMNVNINLTLIIVQQLSFVFRGSKEKMEKWAFLANLGSRVNLV